MTKPWFRYRRIGHLQFAPRLYWPCSWQGWVAYFGLGAIWIIGGNTISILMFPHNTIYGWLAVATLMVAVITLSTVVTRCTGWPTEKHERENSN